MSFLKPTSLYLLFLIPLLLLLYALKLRRKTYTVSSSLLWEHAIEDMKANTPFQRLRKNLLTPLQIIFLTLAIGATMTAENFLLPKTLMVLVLGVVAFATATAAGVLMAKVMNLFSKEKINPMIGAAGVSAVPMAARVVQVMGQKENPRNFLLMHAMGPNVAGAIGAAIAGGVFLGMLS